jgi:hypothetical protein
MPTDPRQGSLLSLPTAARLVYQAAIGKRDAPSEDTLNNIARMIAARTRVFACVSGEEPDMPAMLMPDEVFEGHFEAAGERLTFNDGRPTLTNLCLRHSELGKVIAEITVLYKSSAED